MKWFFCLNDGGKQFDLAKAAISSALANTKLEPVCVYDGTNDKVISWMEECGIPVIRHRSVMFEKACEVYGIDKEALHASFVTGAWMRIDIPLLTDEEYVLYTDTDVLFLGDCKELEDVKPELLGVVCDFNPLNNFNINSGVLLMNARNLRRQHSDFVNYTYKNMKSTWTTCDQIAYEEYYAHRSMRLPIEFNWKAFWEPDHAVWNPDIRVERCRTVQIVHFTGTKPYDKTKYKEGMGLYRGSNNYYWRDIWNTYCHPEEIVESKIPPVIKHNVLYPYYFLLAMEDKSDRVLLEDLIIDCGVNTTDIPIIYPEHIRSRQPKVDMRIWQLPCQMAPFLSWLHGVSHEIQTFTEFGNAYGGNFFFIDSYLRACNPNFDKSTAVDCTNNTMHWYTYAGKFPTTEFALSESLKYVPPAPMDFCFIDSSHTYEMTMAEYLRFKPYCKYMAFHDISGDAGSIRFWEEIKDSHEHWEFCEQYSNLATYMGIGVIKI
jgi:lipopolysaccharide biosynthesis glycosyltransferase